MSRFRRFLVDRCGNVAIEFAFILPMVIVLLFGTIEITNMLMVNRKVTATAQSLADLVTQYDQIEAADLAQLDSAVRWMLEPYSASQADYGIAHVVFDEAGNASIDSDVGGWRHDHGLSVDQPTARVNGLGLGNDAIVVVELAFDYPPVVGRLILSDDGPITLRQFAYSRPRNEPTIPLIP